MDHEASPPPAAVAPPTKTRGALLIGIFLTSLALIALQVTLTRVFSVMIWNHFSFMAISVALLGFSLAGLFYFFFPITLRLPTPVLMLIGTVGFLVGLFAVGYFIVASPHIASKLAASHVQQRDAAAVYLIYLFSLLVVPFFFCGFVISAAIVKEAADIGRIYAANLLGSGMACLVVIASLNYLGAARTFLVVFAIGLLTIVCYAWNRRRLWVTALFGLPALVLAGITLYEIVTLPPTEPVVQPLRLLNKRTDAMEGAIRLRKWNSFSCVDFYAKEPYEGFWGLKREVYDGPLPQNIGVLIDSWALTTVVNVTDDLEASRVFDFVPSSLPFALLQGRESPPDVLIIGSGGGIDVLTARHHGAGHITAVEINPLIVEGALRRYEELRDLDRYAGIEGWTNQSVYDLPGVEVHVAEGRNFVDRTDLRFDLIMIPGVDTATGTEAGNFSFSENYLYTVDAMEAYLEKLKEDGLLYVLRFKVTKQPSEMLRLAAIAEEALRRRGVSDPRRRMLIYHSNVHVFACLVVKNGADFTADELSRAHAKLEEQLKCSVLFSPGQPPEKNEPHFHQYLASTGPDRERFLAGYPYRVRPVTDDQPFFFNFTRFQDIFHPLREGEKGHIHLLYYVGQTVLYYCFLGVLALGLVFVVLPLLKFAVMRTTIPGRWRFVGYFVALGFSYIVIEIVLMQKFVFFLGYPVYAMTVILFSLLTFSGLGSLVTARMRSGLAIAVVFLSLLGAQAAIILLFDRITGATFAYSLPARIAVAVAVTGPLGFLMGMPFPLGVRYAATHARPILPWIWALNGYASVLGSVSAVILAIHVGFTYVLLAGLGVYAVAFLLLASLHRSEGGPATG